MFKAISPDKFLGETKGLVLGDVITRPRDELNCGNESRPPQCDKYVPKKLKQKSDYFPSFCSKVKVIFSFFSSCLRERNFCLRCNVECGNEECQRSNTECRPKQSYIQISERKSVGLCRHGFITNRMCTCVYPVMCLETHLDDMTSLPPTLSEVSSRLCSPHNAPR